MATSIPGIATSGTALIRGGFGLYHGKVLVYLQTGRKLSEAPEISLIKE
jgi:hypothetical protein